jgi:hypothetical protein
MRLWQAAPLVVLLVSLPVLSACDFLGLGSKKSQEQEAYEQQVKALEEQQAAQEEYQKEQQQYYDQVQKALDDYYKQYEAYQEQQVQQQLQAQGATSNQTGLPPVTVTMPPPQTLTTTSTPGS